MGEARSEFARHAEPALGVPVPRQGMLLQRVMMIKTAWRPLGSFGKSHGNIHSLVKFDSGAQPSDGTGTEKVSLDPLIMSRSYIEQLAENFTWSYYYWYHAFPVN